MLDNYSKHPLTLHAQTVCVTDINACLYAAAFHILMQSLLFVA